MKIINKTMKNKGRTIAVTHYVPVEPRASIQILHGMAEHKDRYKEFLTYLTLNNIHCVIHNHRGHGSDEKKSNLGHFDSFEDLIDDAKVVYRSMPRDLPRFALGHSMGSIILRRLLTEDLYDGAIIVGTGSKLSFKDAVATKFLKVLGKVIPKSRSTLINKLAFFGYDSNFKGNHKNRWLSKEDSNVISYNEDPHAGQKMSVKALSEILSNIRHVDSSKVIRQYKNIPYLLIGGNDDPFSHFARDYEILRYRLRRLSDYVDVILEPNARHEVLFEENRGAVFSKIVNWVYLHGKK